MTRSPLPPDDPPPIANVRILQETFIERIESHVSLPSTNNRGLELAAETDLATPTLVIAADQSAGRGRGGNSWFSSPGALTFSLVIDRPDELPPERVSLVSLAAGLACRDALAALTPEAAVRLKWPNDLFLAGRKLAGILTETTTRAPERLVLGIGLNANNSLAAMPAELQTAGISLADYRGAPIEATELLVRLLIALEADLARFTASGTIDPRRWSEHCLLTGRTVTLQIGPRQITGTCQGITPEGGLRLERGGRVETMTAGEVLAW